MKNHLDSEVLSHKEHTVCFSGHRPGKLPNGGKSDALLSALHSAVEAEIAKGKQVFINGAMAGFDILGAEAVIRLRMKHPHIKCATVAPFRVGFFNTENWTQEWKSRALAIYRASDVAFTLAENYRRGIYYYRDDYMVDHSSAVISYYEGKIIGRQARGKRHGGTEYTVDYAYDLGLPITNLWAIENL